MRPHAADPDHFAAYSFVDRIDEFVPGTRARGHFAIPAALDRFSSCLVAEAVGQLAAWISMDKIDFRGRPVAALATETWFHGEAHPGDTLALAVDVQQCDDEAIAYGGTASIDGRKVIELVDCLGPMLPVAEFDAPEVLRERLDLLRTKGAKAGRFHGVSLPPLIEKARVPGTSLDAEFDVPAQSAYFNDHFPRRHVFPATLLLDMQTRLAHDLAAEASWAKGRDLRFHRVTHVKMRAFIEPEQSITIGVTLNPPADGIAKAMLNARAGERTVASARLELAVQ